MSLIVGNRIAANAPKALHLILGVWLAGNLTSVLAGLCYAILAPVGQAWLVVLVDTVATMITALAAIFFLRAHVWAWLVLLGLAIWNGIHAAHLAPIMLDNTQFGTVGPFVLNILTVGLGITLLHKPIRELAFKTQPNAEA